LKLLLGALFAVVSWLASASVCRGLQDELFNLTLDLVKMQAERTRAEAKLDGSIQRVQLDNQMLVRWYAPGSLRVVHAADSFRGDSDVIDSICSQVSVPAGRIFMNLQDHLWVRSWVLNLCIDQWLPSGKSEIHDA